MKEKTFHKIWEQQYICFDKLQLQSGEPLRIIDSGTYNTGDGPDFLNARIVINNIMLVGDIELHINSEDWYKHGHHQDPSYNGVILHVVLETPEEKPVYRKDGTLIPELALSDAIPLEIQPFLHTHSQKLACEQHIHLLDDSLLENHLRDMHLAYFDYSVDKLLSSYPYHLSVDEAWLYLITLATFRVGGFHKNVNAMERLHHILWAKYLDSGQWPCVEDALEISGLSSESSQMNRKEWDYSGCRPANQPPKRIAQSIHLVEVITNMGWREFLHESTASIPKILYAQLSTKQRFGATRWQQWIYQAFVPSVYILGSLSGKHALHVESRGLWQAMNRKIDGNITEYFEASGWPKTALKQQGHIHLYKRYCKPQACMDCKIFKSVISA